MDFIIDLLVDILGDLFIIGGEEALKNSKTPKPVRYLVAILLLIFFIVVIGGLSIAGIGQIKEQSIAGGIALLAAAVAVLVLAVSLIIRIRKAIKSKEDIK